MPIFSGTASSDDIATNHKYYPYAVSSRTEDLEKSIGNINKTLMNYKECIEAIHKDLSNHKQCIDKNCSMTISNTMEAAKNSAEITNVKNDISDFKSDTMKKIYNLRITIGVFATLAVIEGGALIYMLAH